MQKWADYLDSLANGNTQAIESTEDTAINQLINALKLSDEQKYCFKI